MIRLGQVPAGMTVRLVEDGPLVGAVTFDAAVPAAPVLHFSDGTTWEATLSGDSLTASWLKTAAEVAELIDAGPRRVSLRSPVDGQVYASGSVRVERVPGGTPSTVVPSGGSITVDTVDGVVQVTYNVSGGGGGGAVDSVNGQTGAVVLDAANVGAATSAQGSLADTAVQPADLAPYATDSDLSAHASDTTGVHGIADTSALVVTTDPRLSDARTPTAHTHDDRYFTETEADGRFVRTVNGTGPDHAGNVEVTGGSGTDIDPTLGTNGQAWVTTSAWAGWADVVNMIPDPDNPGLYLIATPVPADTTAPSVPTGLIAVAGSESTITLSWTASTDLVGVTGYEYRINGGTAIDAGAGTTENVTGLTAGTEYTFEVRAYDAAGNRSEWSAPAVESTDGEPVGVEFAYRGSGQSLAPTLVTTIAALPIGTASPTRTVIAVVGVTGNVATNTRPDVTIGGVTPTYDAQVKNTDTTNTPWIIVCRANVPTGETADVVVTSANTAPYVIAVSVWSASGGVVASDTLAAFSPSTGAPVTGVVTGATDGLIVGAASIWQTGTAAVATLTALTERFNGNRQSFGDSAAVGDITLSPTFTQAGHKALAAVAYAPA